MWCEQTRLWNGTSLCDGSSLGRPLASRVSRHAGLLHPQTRRREDCFLTRRNLQKFCDVLLFVLARSSRLGHVGAGSVQEGDAEHDEAEVGEKI